MNMAEARARRALAQAGLDAGVELTPASSVTNEVWLTPDHVVRVNRRQNQRLRREAALAPTLPDIVGYPAIVGYGGQVGADWLIVERVPGTVLSRCWPTMSEETRRFAIGQLVERLRAIHATPAPPGLAEIESPQLVSARHTDQADALVATIDRVRALPGIDRGLIASVAAQVEDLVPSLEPFGGTRLIHGDLTFENILWDRDHISAVLDFEWARGAPADLDLDVLLRFCAFPFLHVAADYEDLTRAEDYAPIAGWIAELYPEVFDHPRGLDRLILYSIAYDLRELLAFPPKDPAHQLSPFHPLSRLRRTTLGTGHVEELSRAVARSC